MLKHCFKLNGNLATRSFVMYSLLFYCNLFAGTIPDSLITNWSKAGLTDNIEYPPRIISILDVGGLNDSSGNNSIAFQNAVNALHGNPGIVCFPSGKFLFTNPINIPANIILKGNSSDSTTLYFNLSGNNNCINVQGSVSTTQTSILSGLLKDNTIFTVASSADFNTGDYIQIKEDGNTLMASTWAYNSLYQLAKIVNVSGNNITIASPLRITFNQNLHPVIIKVNTIQKVGIECLKIKRLDATVNQTSNIYFVNAANCWIKGVESINSNYAHFLIESSIHCTLEGNYIHDAFAYGGGGQGYGFVLQSGSSENLIYNNIAKHLRHCVLLQAAANGNVIAYNYTTDPFWVEGIFPSNSAGDIVLHGNYNFTNLIEGNICQNIIIDNSHGDNGPYNTFFRNRAELYGIVMNTTAGNKSNFIGNEVTNTGFLLGNYSLTGSNFQYGNNIKSAITPTGTTNLPEITLFKIPFSSPIGIPNVLNSGTNSAKTRWLASGTKTVSSGVFYCSTDTSALTTGLQQNKAIQSFNIYPNPGTGECIVVYDVKNEKTTQLQVVDISGQIIYNIELSTGNKHVLQLKQNNYSGMCQLQIIQNGILVASAKMLLIKTE